MIQNYFDNVKRILGSLISNARAREGWSKGNIFFSGAFCKAKYEIRRRRKRGLNAKTKSRIIKLITIKL